MKQVLTVIGVIVLVVVLSVVAWQGYWWLNRASTQRQAEIREDTFARQTALADEVITLYDDVTTVDVQLLTAARDQRPALEAQRAAFVDRLCDAYGRMNGTVGIPASTEAFAEGEC